MAKKAKTFRRNDIVRVTNSVSTLESTQWAPREFAEAIAGKECKVLAAHKDGSYDLEGTQLMLDSSVLTYVSHYVKPKKHEHDWAKGEVVRVCKICGKSRKVGKSVKSQVCE